MRFGAQMISNYSQHEDVKVPAREPFVSQVEFQKVRETLQEVHDLLEQYAPAWYPEQLQKKVESVLGLDR